MMRGLSIRKPRTRQFELPALGLSFFARMVLAVGFHLVSVVGSIAWDARVLEVENIVQTAGKGTSAWAAATKDQSLSVGDRIRTRQRSRATLALTGLFTVRLDQFTTVEITPGLVDSRKPKLDFAGGAAFIFSREKSGEMDIRMPGANAALRGTQLFVRVGEDGKSVVQVLEGQVELDNPHGHLLLTRGEAGEAIQGRAPRKTAVIDAKNLLQWALYYPAVVDPEDLALTPAEEKRYAASLDSYRRGDLLGAVRRLTGGTPAGNGARVYQAAALLAVGRVDEARKLITGVPAEHPGRRSIERMNIAVMGHQGNVREITSIHTASEAMAESYYLQSRTELAAATLAARRATDLAPENGFAWTRLAELEFSAGRTRQAREAIQKAAGLTPDSARFHSLRGFISCAENRIGEGRESFERAVLLDGSFGNAWLGLGLTKIKQGDLEGGRADLQTAATVEPTSSIFHSYLGKAMSQDGRKEEAMKDLDLARALDPNDPTPPLYLALENQRNNRPNAAIGNLRESIRLNDNRRLYRSEFLLDQDRAVRSANLARIYQNAGMKEVAVREATRAVESDYTNASAHFFLANSFDALRDPDRTLLRYETPWFNELLLSNLLSPVGGGPLSQFVSQQEYSKLLEADGVGGSLLTDWRSTSELRTTASVFGTHGNLSYGLDAYYRNDDGERPNSDIELQEIYGQIKWQPTPDDIFNRKQQYVRGFFFDEAEHHRS
jgi:tetratricopeptide (TPR) repeat protein